MSKNKCGSIKVRGEGLGVRSVIMSGCVKQPKMDSNKKNIVEIYTDWANHYLEKTKVQFITINILV